MTLKQTLAAAALALSATPALASEWELDPAHSSAQFAVRHMGDADAKVAGQGALTPLIDLFKRSHNFFRSAHGRGMSIRNSPDTGVRGKRVTMFWKNE